MSAWRRADPSARLTDSGEALRPTETTFADAQRSVNFPVFEPEWLPGDCRVTELTLRPEQPPGRPDGVSTDELGQTPHSEGNPCALRAVVAGSDRRLRLKQFLYDWAPPAASVAPLWESPEPAPFDCGSAVGWLGTDYKGNRGACVQRERTQIEVSVTAGAFDDGELQDLLSGLAPVDAGGSAAVRRAPFHWLNYWVRHGERPVSVPHGLWDHTAVHPYEESTPLSPAALTDAPTTPLVPPGEQFALDSAAVFPAADAIECVFRNRRNGSDHLWTLAAPGDSSVAPSVPPEPSDQPAETTGSVDLRGTTVHYAALTEGDGAWEAMWTEDGVHHAAWAGASQYLDGDGFRGLVDALQPPREDQRR